ncbi:hypothetical protein HPP92_018167 [Vanilla planifolia]|uniref:Mitochondrial import inner membrane translocase subunit n=1 Tax=Vanilla planifolia TaxID=51239 RepID=A0A835QF30_VANPL|nr:hypothetical protein HPP92_018167 [Vanilla planifolia]
MAAKATSSTIEKEQIFGMAEKEMEYRVELFNKLTHTCFNKCVEKRYKESELNMGENSCIDRCVSKYWQAIAPSRLPSQFEEGKEDVAHENLWALHNFDGRDGLAKIVDGGEVHEFNGGVAKYGGVGQSPASCFS